jgi:hypothetical protein
MTKKNDSVVSNETGNNVVKKRGRKSKKEIELAKAAAAAEAEAEIKANENINVIIEETVDKVTTPNIDDLLKSSELIDSEENENVVEENISVFSSDANQLEDNKPVAKKRGRKPKGGKIIQQTVSLNNTKETKPNIILHLKCSLKDLCINTVNSSDIQGFDFQNSTQLPYDEISTETATDVISMNHQSKNTENDYEYDDYEENKSHKDNDIRDVWKKLKVLEHNLHINNICDKKSACFWCTYDFDNPPVYIPKHFMKDSYHVYGCFCSPECATAYLMEENIDSSSKFERYHLINHIYSKIYDYKKNIKPAPNPYYMLDKYYGNLSIQEYRSLLRNERLFLVVDKPLTRILPELHEDNDDFIINNKIIPSNTYQIKKKLQKKQTKTNILSEKFGLNH